VIAIDTNLLVRLTVRDDTEQAAAVERLLRETSESGETCFISDPVLCELTWVLRTSYGADRSQVLDEIRNLLAQDLFEFEDRAGLQRALNAYQQGRADFSDYLIGEKGVARGVTATYTFDRKLRGWAGFAVLTP
jgi:predicted nucleic-acid-binding protein